MHETYVVNVKVGGKYVGIPVMRGEPGRTMVLRLDDKRIQWKYDDETEDAWRILFDLSTIETVKGDKGEPGKTPYIGENGHWFVGETDTGVSARGDPGHTPERGVDYWTDADKQEIQSYVNEAILNGEW